MIGLTVVKKIFLKIDRINCYNKTDIMINNEKKLNSFKQIYFWNTLN